jgi:hypothetical protein
MCLHSSFNLRDATLKLGNMSESQAQVVLSHRPSIRASFTLVLFQGVAESFNCFSQAADIAISSTYSNKRAAEIILNRCPIEGSALARIFFCCLLIGDYRFLKSCVVIFTSTPRE